MSEFSMELLEEKIQKSENLLKEELATVRAGGRMLLSLTGSQ